MFRHTINTPPPADTIWFEGERIPLMPLGRIDLEIAVRRSRTTVWVPQPQLLVPSVHEMLQTIARAIHLCRTDPVRFRALPAEMPDVSAVDDDADFSPDPLNCFLAPWNDGLHEHGWSLRVGERLLSGRPEVIIVAAPIKPRARII